MSKSLFQTPLSITYIGTATTILQLPNLTSSTDPYFSPPNTEWRSTSGAKLISHYTPSHTLSLLPRIDLEPLSHEDHKDNLDDLGRQLLDGRRVVTTSDGANRLQPRPGVTGLKAWESLDLTFGGEIYTITATPCQHSPGGECVGFILTADSSGTPERKPNALYVSGDTVWLRHFARVREKCHISIALLNMGKAMVHKPDGNLLQITMDAKQCVRLMKDVGAEVVVPLHSGGWNHFKESRDEMLGVLKEECVEGTFRVLGPGVPAKIF